MPNEIYALHLDGKQFDRTEFARIVGNSGNWNPPKLMYKRKCDATKAYERLPEKVKTRTEIVRYIPEITE